MPWWGLKSQSSKHAPDPPEVSDGGAKVDVCVCAYVHNLVFMLFREFLPLLDTKY